MQKNISVNPPTTSSTNAYETLVVLFIYIYTLSLYYLGISVI